MRYNHYYYNNQSNSNDLMQQRGCKKTGSIKKTANLSEKDRKAVFFVV
jgi:hypothetical protein